MKKPLALAGLVALVWIALDAGATASARTVSAGPPMLQGGDQLKIVACAVAAAAGLVMVLWSLRPERHDGEPVPVRVRARHDDPRGR